MMSLPLVQLDDRLDAVLHAEQDSPERVRADFRKRFALGWLYHELHLEGIIVNEDDLYRAIAGRKGRDYCDDVLLDQVRAFQRCMQRVKRAAFQREPLNRRLLDEYHALLVGEPQREPRRTDSGATEAYKHDVVEPEFIDAELDAALAEAHSFGLLRHPARAAMQLHYRLVRVWPYQQYSAAVARMAMNHMLLAAGFPPAVIHASDRQRYYHSLHYDISRSESLVFETLENQIAMRERIFRPYQRTAVRELRVSA